MPTPLEQWIDECARITRPKAIHWCDDGEFLDFLSAASELGVESDHCFAPFGKLQMGRLVGMSALAKSVQSSRDLLSLAE